MYVRWPLSTRLNTIRCEKTLLSVVLKSNKDVVLYLVFCYTCVLITMWLEVAKQWARTGHYLRGGGTTIWENCGSVTFCDPLPLKTG